MIESMVLNGNWELFGVRDAVDFCGAFDKKNSDAIFMAGRVPGNVELDLERSGHFKPLYYADNIKQLEGYNLYQWWYRTYFTVDKIDESYEPVLCFNGVDTFATYYLNGEEIGKSRNMLIEHVMHVGGYLRKGKNELVVRLDSPVREAALCEQYSYMISFPTNFASMSVRQAPHMYGWDIMPRAVTYGIWKDVFLHFLPARRISRIYIETLSANESSSQMWLQYELSVPPEDFGKLTFRLRAECDGSKVEVSERVHFNAATVRFGVDMPKLWFPAGSGRPAALYSGRVELLDGDRILDSKEIRFGIRKFEVDRSAIISGDSRFVVCVNGHPIFIRGTNYVPADAFHSRDIDRYQKILQNALDCNCNLVRSWGGNVYESDEFFNFCDENGLMVWQDIAMACSLYPINDEFKGLLSEEIKKVALRLRNHPSLLLYCGDNECDYGFNQFGLDPNRNELTRETIPRELFKWDCFKHYLPSSPYYSPEVFAAKNTELLPEEHLWGPRDYFKSRYYREYKAHFISEMGYHGCPGVSSIKQFISPEQLEDYEGEEWILHSSAPTGKESPFAYRNKLMANQAEVMFGKEFRKLEEFALASQISQAEADKFFIENMRQRKFEKAGIVWWNIQDGWPQFSDAVVDWYGVKKLAYYYIKASQEPVMFSAGEPEDWHIPFYICNDILSEVSGEYEILDETGELLKKDRFSCPANGVIQAMRLWHSPSKRGLYLLRLRLDGGKTLYNHYLCGMVPHSFTEYKQYLKLIADFSGAFSASEIAA